VVVQHWVDINTKNGTNNRPRFTSNTPLPAALPVQTTRGGFLAIADDARERGEFNATEKSDDVVFVVVIETKVFFSFIIGFMTRSDIRSPSAKDWCSSLLSLLRWRYI